MEYEYKTYQEIHEEEEFKQRKVRFEETNNMSDLLGIYNYVFDRVSKCEEYCKKLEENFEKFVNFKDVEIGNPFEIKTPDKPIKLVFVGDAESGEE
jgi:hypothetical protein